MDAVVTKARNEDVDEWQFKSPLDPKMWRAWADLSGDPDRWISRWAEDGAPLGMAKEIPSSEGVFPPSKGKDAVEDVTPELEDQIKVVNYKSFVDFPEDAAIEVDRLVEANFAKVINKKVAAQKFGEGTVSRIALLVKQKEDMTVKRRIIVDMRRSGGNDRASCPERIILPRIQDVTKMGQDMAKRCSEVEEATWNYREVIGCHWTLVAGDDGTVRGTDPGLHRRYFDDGKRNRERDTFTHRHGPLHTEGLWSELLAEERRKRCNAEVDWSENTPQLGSRQHTRRVDLLHSEASNRRGIDQPAGLGIEGNDIPQEPEENDGKTVVDGRYHSEDALGSIGDVRGAG